MTAIEFEEYVKWWWSGEMAHSDKDRTQFSEDYFDLPFKLRHKIQDIAVKELRRLAMANVGKQ